MTPVFLSPDCRDGNDHKCDHQAWDDINDEPTKCGCDCHGIGMQIISEDGPELLTMRGGKRNYRPGGNK